MGTGLPGDLLAGQVPGPPEPAGYTAPDDGIPDAFRRRRESLFLKQFRDRDTYIQAKDPTDPAADPRLFGKGPAQPSADEVIARIQAANPGLAERLGQGLSPDELQRMTPEIMEALQAADAPPGQYGFLSPDRPLTVRHSGPELVVTDDMDSVPEDDGPELVIEDLDPDDEDAGRLLIGDRAQVRAWHEREKAADRRALKLIPGGRTTSGLVRSREAAEAIGLRENWTGQSVLGIFAGLKHRYQNPDGYLSDYLAYFMRHHVRQDRKTAFMFWPVDLARGADLDEGAQLARLIARGLGSARACQVSPKMCRKMRADWDDRPDVPVTLDEGRLPAKAGFAWLDSPWLTDVEAGYWLPVRAVSWERTMVWASSRNGIHYGIRSGQSAPLDAVRIVLWLHVTDDVAFGRWKGSEGRAPRTSALIGSLVPMQIALLPFGSRISLGGRYQTNGEALMGVMITLWKTMGELLPKSRTVRATAPDVLRRIRKAGLDYDTIQVIYLREYEYVGDEPPAQHPQPVDWRGRWWVDEHCRHLDPYEDRDPDSGRRRKHKAEPARQPGLLPDDDHDVCAVCMANGQTVRVALVHTFAKGPTHLPFIRPARDRQLLKLVR